MKITKMIVLTAMFLVAFSAFAGDAVEKKPGKRVVVIGDGDVAFSGDSHDWQVEGVKRGFMGVSMVSLTPGLRDYFGVADGLGVLVSAVVPDGPAAKAGLKAGDVIVEIDGDPVDGPAVLGRNVRMKKGGDQVKIDVRRKGTSQQFFVTLDERDVSRVELRLPDIERWVERDGDHEIEIFEGEEGNAALDRMRVFFESPEFKTRVEKLRGDCSEYQERLQDIEKRMKDLEKKLEKLK